MAVWMISLLKMTHSLIHAKKNPRPKVNFINTIILNTTVQKSLSLSEDIEKERERERERAFFRQAIC